MAPQINENMIIVAIIVKQEISISFFSETFEITSLNKFIYKTCYKKYGNFDRSLHKKLT